MEVKEDIDTTDAQNLDSKVTICTGIALEHLTPIFGRSIHVEREKDPRV